MFLGGPWLSFDAPAIVRSKTEAIELAAGVPGWRWPGTSIEVLERPDGFSVEREWLGLSEATLVVKRQGRTFSVPIDGIEVPYGFGETAQMGIFLLPALIVGFLVFRSSPFRRRASADATAHASSDPSGELGEHLPELDEYH